MAVGREASIDSFSFPAVCYEVDPKDLEGSHVPRISSQDPPMCLFLPDSPCLPAAKFIPLNGTCQQTRDPLARKPSETVFENSSRQTRVKKKEKKKRKGKEKKGFSPLLSVIGLWHGRFSFSCGFALSSIILLYGMILLERPIYSIYRFWIVD